MTAAQATPMTRNVDRGALSAGDPVERRGQPDPPQRGQAGAPFHAVFTAEQARAYKPRFRAFEYMLEKLGCRRDEVLHVSSSLRYDLIPAHDLRIPHKVYVNRGHEPSVPWYRYHEMSDLSGLPSLLGL